MKTRRAALLVLAMLIGILVMAEGIQAQVQYYVLDGFGGVHAGNGAAAISPATPYFGFDIATDIAYAPGFTSDGILVLDGFGGVHPGGGLLGLVASDTPYFGFRVAQAIAYRNIPPRLGFSVQNSAGPEPIDSQNYFALRSTTINAPNDGFVLVMCTIEISIPSTEARGFARFAVGVDALDETLMMGWTTRLESGVLFEPTFPQTWQQTVVVSAGAHSVHCLARGDGRLTSEDPSLTAIFIDHNSSGSS